VIGAAAIIYALENQAPGSDSKTGQVTWP